jgi:hypothetical protein
VPSITAAIAAAASITPTETIHLPLIVFHTS